jgi:hypothetical protein
MYKNFLKVFFLSVFLFFAGGCVHQELVPPDQTRDLASQATTQSSSQSQSTVDISDLGASVNSSSSAPAIAIRRPAQPQQPQNTQVVQRIPFPIQEYANLPKSGTATIQGKLYIISPNGQKIFGKNTRLYLNPITSYSQQWYKESYLGHKKLSKADSRLYNYLRFTVSDNEGNFSFYGVPAGRYYLIGIVKCKDECGYDKTQNIRIAKEVSVSSGESVNVDLSRYAN